MISLKFRRKSTYFLKKNQMNIIENGETFISTQHEIIHLQKYTLIHAVALITQLQFFQLPKYLL